MNHDEFVRKYIVQINSAHFSKIFDKVPVENNPFNSTTDLDEYLKNQLYKKFPILKDQIFDEWKNLDFIKSKIELLANKYFFKKSHLSENLLREVGYKMCEKLSNDDFDELIDQFINRIDSTSATIGFKTIKSDFKKVFLNSLHFNFQRGFPVNLENINSGVMTANAGDSHQFLFLARAILAGFNCSNVDVRSSRYDAIIDYNENLYRIQIKGITSSTSNISFKDRDRGGQGIDHKHERNVGKKITSKDCDIYAAVDKNSGVCYLIPMKWIDEKNIESISLNDVAEYKEAWDIFEKFNFN